MKVLMSRTAGRAVRCPACEATPGERCRGARGKPREANHQERVEAAAAKTALVRDERDWDAGMRTGGES
jgi:hypothetical protein